MGRGDGVGSVPPVLSVMVEFGWGKPSMCCIKSYTWSAFAGGFPMIENSSAISNFFCLVQYDDLHVFLSIQLYGKYIFNPNYLFLLE